MTHERRPPVFQRISTRLRACVIWNFYGLALHLLVTGSQERCSQVDLQRLRINPDQFDIIQRVKVRPQNTVGHMIGVRPQAKAGSVRLLCRLGITARDSTSTYVCGKQRFLNSDCPRRWTISRSMRFRLVCKALRLKVTPAFDGGL